MKLFMDSEFTGLQKNTTLISLALVDENDKLFYAEFVDYDISQVDNWINDNVLSNLILTDNKLYYEISEDGCCLVKGNKLHVKEAMLGWMSQYNKVDIWSDCLAYDWVLFNDLFGNALNIPRKINYIPFDICTLFEFKGIDPDISREQYAITKSKEQELISSNPILKYVKNPKDIKHNALWDALVIKECYNKLMGITSEKVKKDWLVYLLECSDNTYYCGATNNIIKRTRDHNSGKGAKYTRGRLPVKLIDTIPNLTKSEALSLEHKIKKLKKKEKLFYFKEYNHEENTIHSG